MISLGLKETESVDFGSVMKDFILEHYSEDGEAYSPEIEDFNELRNDMICKVTLFEKMIIHWSKLYHRFCCKSNKKRSILISLKH